MHSNSNQHTLLTRGVEEIIGKEAKQRLNTKKLRVKLGIDPTSPNIHIGRSIPLLKLRDFQSMGHKVVLIIGDFTGTIGDTSDKDSERPMLTQSAVEKNMQQYIAQVEKILDIGACEIHYNSEWFESLTYREIGQHADLFSINNFISRDNIARRLKNGKRVSLREVMYPLMQGYDSVAIKADVELGGTDQKFNILAGRTLQKHYNLPPQAVMLNPLIEGLDGRKMSSSWGNTINLTDSPRDMFGKIMSLGDELIIRYFTLLTRVDMKDIADFQESLNSGANPRDIKIELAKAIVAQYHSNEQAIEEAHYFVSAFTRKDIPDDIPAFKPSDLNVISILLESKLVGSTSEARRAISQGGVKINQTKVTDATQEVPRGSILQKGKIKFIKVI